MPKPVSFPFPIRAQLPPNSAFGKRPLYNDFHSGVDFNSTTGVTYGKPVPAAGAGTVVESYNGNTAGMSNWAKLRGTMVAIDHGDGWRTRYHMLVPNSNIKVGTKVKAGDIIGRVGSSGSSTTGAHLHFELWHNGVAINPVGQLTYNPTALASGSSSPFDNTSPSKPKDTDTMIVVSNPQGEYYALAPEFIHWLGSETDRNLVAAISSTLDEVHKLSQRDFDVALEAYGVPHPMGVQKNLRAFGAGDMWSRQIENQRKMDDLWTRTGDVWTRVGEVKFDAAVVERAISEALAKQDVNIEIDVQAIAKAVNDDLHARTAA